MVTVAEESPRGAPRFLDLLVPLVEDVGNEDAYKFWNADKTRPF